MRRRGDSLLALDIGLPLANLPLVEVASGKTNYAEATVDAINRRGKAIHCQVRLTPLSQQSKEREGVIVMIEELGES